MIMAALYNFIGFCIFYLAYKNIFGVKFIPQKLPYIAAVLMACLIQVGVFHWVDNTWKDTVVIITGWITAVLLTERKRGKSFLLFPVVYFLSGLINIMSSYVLAAILGISWQVLCDSDCLTLIVQFTPIIVCSVYGIIVKRKFSYEISFGFGQYCILILGIACCFLVVAFTQGLLINDDFIQTIKNEVVIASIVLAFLFVVLSFWQQITWKKAQKYQLENERYQLYLDRQEEHIHMLINEDERRRRLKHDMHAHMLALDTLAQKGDLEMLRQYLQKMEEGLNSEQIEKYTGISVVDAIIGEVHIKAVEQQVLWEFEGCIKKSDDISAFELCTVFSNLLTNALEAVQRAEEDKHIVIKVSNFQGKMVLQIGNSCDEKLSGKGKPQTSKKDKLSHGLGLKNVEEIISKRDGSIEYEAKNGWFQVTVVL